MALKTERGEHFENVNDEFSNSNIARRFQSLNGDWVKVSRMMRKDFPKLQELERINILSKLMKVSITFHFKLTIVKCCDML